MFSQIIFLHRRKGDLVKTNFKDNDPKKKKKKRNFDTHRSAQIDD